MLSCLLNRPADAGTMATLVGYEQLISAALMTSAAQEGNDVADMLAVLQSRGAIEQAKGMVMACLRCDADEAWATLRRASHESTSNCGYLPSPWSSTSGAPRPNNRATPRR